MWSSVSLRWESPSSSRRAANAAPARDVWVGCSSASGAASFGGGFCVVSGGLLDGSLGACGVFAGQCSAEGVCCTDGFAEGGVSSTAAPPCCQVHSQFAVDRDGIDTLSLEVGAVAACRVDGCGRWRFDADVYAGDPRLADADLRGQLAADCDGAVSWVGGGQTLEPISMVSVGAFSSPVLSAGCPAHETSRYARC